MANLSDILALGSQQAFDRAQAEPPPPPEPSNLRAGALDFRASLNNAMALGAEGLGFNDTSKNLRAEAELASQQAEGYATPLSKTTSEDVTGPIDAWNKGQTGAYIGDTLRNLPSTVTRGVAGMAGPLVAGAAGTALGGPLAGLALGSAAAIPQTTGDIAGRQYANKDNTDGVGTRIAKAAGLGTLSAVAQNVVPTWMGGKLIGGVAEHAAAKTLATAASSAARPTLAGSIARNLSEAIGGNAAAGAGAEALNQIGAGEAMDPNKIAGAGVEGAAMGTAFAPLGVAGEMAHRGPNTREAAAIARSRAERGLAPDGTPLPPKAPGGAPGAPAEPVFGTAPVDPNSATGGGQSFDTPKNVNVPPSMRPQGPTAPGGAPDTPAGRKAARDAAAAAAAPEKAADVPESPSAKTEKLMDDAKAGKGIAEKLAGGESLVDNAEEFVGAVGEKAQQMYDKGKKTATDWVQKTAQAYIKRRDLNAEQRAMVEKAIADPSDPFVQSEMGKMAQGFAEKERDFAELDGLDLAFPEKKKGELNSKLSASTAGVENRIGQITEPYLKGKDPEVVARVNGVLRRVVASAAEGDMNEPAARRLVQLLGAQGAEVVRRVYDAVAPKDAVADARMARHIKLMQSVGERERGLGKVIDENLPEGHNINVRHLKDALTRWARGDDEVGVDSRGKAHHASMRQQIEDMFGPKADKVFDALEEYVKREDDKPGSTQGIKHDKDALDRGEQGSRRGDIAQEAGADYGDMDEGAMDPVYYGGGSNPLAMTALLEDPDVYRAKHERESPAETLFKKLKGKDGLPEDAGGSGKRNIYWMSEKAYNQRHGIREPVLTPDGHETGEFETKGSTTHGYVVNEGASDPAKFNDNDFKATRLDAKKHGRSPAKIIVDSHVKDELDSTGAVTKKGKKAFLIDAVRLTERFSRNQETGSGHTNIVRNGRAFMDGILALQERLDELGDKRTFVDDAGLEKMVADGEIPVDGRPEDYGIVHLPDSLKIDKFGNTYGDMKKAFRTLDTASEDKTGPTTLNYNEKARLADLRSDYKQQTPEEQALRKKEAEAIYAGAKERAKQKAKDKELAGDRENDLTRRKASMGNKGSVAENKSSWATGEGDVIKGTNKDGSPIYDLSARTQADAWFDEEGIAKAQKAIDQLGDVHGGIDSGKVQERDRASYKQQVADRAGRAGTSTFGPPTAEKIAGDAATTARDARRVAAMNERSEQRSMPDARTGKAVEGYVKEGFDSSGSGRTEVSADENPHLVSAVQGEDMTRGLNMDDSRQSISFDKAFKNDEERRQMMNSVAKLNEAGAPGAKIGRRLAALIDAADSMRTKDVAQLKRVGAQVLSGNLSPAEASTTINELSRKYAATIVDRTETRQNPRGLVERVVRKSWGGEDSAGEPTKPTNTRPVPPEPEMTKKGNKALETSGKGKPSAMLKEALGTHSDTLLDPVARIQQALQNGDVPEVDMKTPRGRKVVKDFAKSSQEFDVTYGADGQPVFTPKAGELKSSLDLQRTQQRALADPKHLNSATLKLMKMFYGGKSAQDIATVAKQEMSAAMKEARRLGTREAIDKAYATAYSIRGVAEQFGNQIDNTPLNKHVQGVLERGGTLGEAMKGFAMHGTESERIIATAINKVAGNVPLSLEGKMPGDFGAYTPDTHSIAVGTMLKGMAAGTVLHEGAHAATVAGLSKSPELMDAAHALLKHVIKEDPSFAHRYAAGNTLEFVAEVMSSPAHQETLRRIPASPEVQSLLGNVKNMWEAFTAMVGKALNIKAEDSHALKQFFELSGAAMKETHGQSSVGALGRMLDMQLPSVKKGFADHLEGWRGDLNENGQKYLDRLQKEGNATYAHLLGLEDMGKASTEMAKKSMNNVPYSDASYERLQQGFDNRAMSARNFKGVAGTLPSGTHFDQMMADEGPHADGSAGSVNDEEHRYAKRDRTAYDQMMDDEGPYQDGRAFSEEGTNRPKAVAAKEAALNKAVSSSDPALIRELRTTDDVHGLQRTYEHIADTAPDSAAHKAATERLREMSLDDDVAYQSTLESKQNAAAATGAAGGIPATTKQDIRDHITKVLGPQVLTAFRNILHEGDFTALAQTSRGVHDLIRISTHSMNPMSTAYHESLHGFVNNLRKAGLHDIVNTLQKAADGTYVRAEMERLVGRDPAVLKQLRGADPEERIAYMYQMWANGDLKLDGKVSHPVIEFFKKVANSFKEMLGIWTNDDRATHIMKYFNDGEYAKDMHSPDLVMAKTMDVHHGKTMAKIRGLTKPFTNVSDTLMASGGQVVRDIGNPALDRMVDLIKRKAGDNKSGDIGYVAASRLAKTTHMNKIADILGNLTEVQRKEVLENLQNATPMGSPEARLAARDVRKFFQGMHKYLTDAGVKIGNLNSDYFPRVWDASVISKNQHAFQGMLDKYVQRGDMTQREADDFVQKIIRTGGNEFDVNTLRPGMQANKERVYAFIEHEDAARFQSKDLFRTINDYVTQATRRAEWDRRFQGQDSINNIFDRARETGATDKDIKKAERYLQGITGVLGDSMNPTLRRLQGNMMVYQNIRLLPLAIFSSLIDSQGIMVRGGTVGEAFKAFKYGIKQIPNNLRDVPKSDVHAELAETMGVIDNAILSATIGEAYQQGMVGDTGRKMNDKFFKYNLMEGWNRSMRVAATHAAINFIGKHADGTYSKHSARFIDELGLTPGDLHYKANGELKLHEGDGLTADQALKMRTAVNQWVDGAILRPDSADKPTWMNDPRFALIAHLKQFTYSFQHTIIDRTVHEAKQGNFSPALSLASYVPVMIAADALKGLLTTGGVPSSKEDWDALDYVGNGIERSGITGVSQFRHDIVTNIKHGGTGLGAVEGPTLDQLSLAVEALRGERSLGSVVVKSMPANAVYASH